MTGEHLGIRVGDTTYALQTPSPEALAHFGRAFAACRDDGAAPAGRFFLEPCGGRWCLRHDGDILADGDLATVIRLLDWELVRRAVMQDSACAAFHAAWVARDGQVVMLAGGGGCGKSRLCLQLLAHGFRVGAEDVAFFRDDQLIPFPRAIQIHRNDPVLRQVDAARVLLGCDGRMCVEVATGEAAGRVDAGDLFVAFLDSADARRWRRLTPLQGLRQLFALCHRLDRVTQPLFDAVVGAAVAGRMVVLPRHDTAAAVLDVLGADR